MLICEHHHYVKNKINQKRVDFVVCDENLESRYIIELDGASHIGRKRFDDDRDAFFAKCGLKTVRFAVSELSMLTEEKIRLRIVGIPQSND